MFLRVASPASAKKQRMNFDFQVAPHLVEHPVSHTVPPVALSFLASYLSPSSSILDTGRPIDSSPRNRVGRGFVVLGVLAAPEFNFWKL